MTGQQVSAAPAPPQGGLVSRVIWVASYVLAAQLLTGYQPWKALIPDAWSGLPAKLGDGPTPATVQEDLWQPMADLVPSGYDLAEHFVTTEDGYILRLFELTKGSGLPGGGWPGSSRNNSSGHTSREGWCSAAAANSTSSRSSLSSSSSRPAVLLQHALMDSSAGWLLLGPERALALQLADAGFGVWMANSRGNRYSRNHTRLQPTDPAFWRFTWQDMARHDLPALVDHVLAASGQRRLVYLGYSQGTTIGLAALSMQPDLQERISLAVLLAPVAIVANMRSRPFVLATMVYSDHLVESLMGFTEWGTFKRSAADRMSALCPKAPWACSVMLEALCGANPRRDNMAPSVLSLLYQHLPCGTSVRNMQLWSQNIRRGCTQHMYHYDHGTACSAADGTPQPCNQHAYGAARPPAFNFSRIATPIALFSGDADTLSVTADVELLKGQLAPGVLAAHHHEPDYAHLDWELGSDAPDRVYPRIVALAQQYSA